MRHVTDYKLCEGGEGQLAKEVRRALAEGWQPLGGPLVLNEVLVQAMVRFGAGETEDVEMVPRKPGPAEENL